jgi:hypothetical protein
MRTAPFRAELGVVSHKVHISKTEALARVETEGGRWPANVDELKAPEADAAAGGPSEVKSVIGARSHHFLSTGESVRLFPYLACQLSVFFGPTSKF